MLDSATPQTVAHQAPLSLGFSGQEYWSGLPFPSPGGVFPIQGSNLGLPHCRQILYCLSHRKELKTCSKAWWGFPGGTNVENPPANAGEVEVAALFPFPRYSVGKICWTRAWQPTPVFLPGVTESQTQLKRLSTQAPEPVTLPEIFGTRFEGKCLLSTSYVSFHMADCDNAMC